MAWYHAGDEALVKTDQSLSLFTIVLFLGIAVVGMGAYLFWQGGIMSMDRIQLGIIDSELENSLRKCEAVRIHRAELESELQDLRGELTTIQKKMPESIEVGEHSKALTSWAQTSGLVIEKIVPYPLQHSEFYDSMRVELYVQGTSKQVKDVVKRWSDLPTVVRVGNVLSKDEQHYIIELFVISYPIPKHHATSNPCANHLERNVYWPFAHELDSRIAEIETKCRKFEACKMELSMVTELYELKYQLRSMKTVEQSVTSMNPK